MDSVRRSQGRGWSRCAAPPRARCATSPALSDVRHRTRTRTAFLGRLYNCDTVRKNGWTLSPRPPPPRLSAGLLLVAHAVAGSICGCASESAEERFEFNGLSGEGAAHRSAGA